MDNRPLLSVVLINYNSGRKLRNCIGSIMADAEEIGADLIVVDNASQDGSLDFLSEPGFSSILVICNKIPLGYCFAANQGFIKSKGRYVLFSNPDMIVRKGTIRRMLDHIMENRSLGAVSGYYLKPDLSFEKYYNAFPSVLSLLLTLYLPPKIAARFQSYRSYHMIGVPFTGETEVQQPAGAFFMADKEILGDAYISPEFGLMFGDVEVAWKICLSGKKISVFQDCPVIHDHGKRSMRKTEDISTEYLYTTDYFVSMSNFFKRYHGRPKAAQVKFIFGFMLAITALGFFLKEIFTLGNPFRVFWYRLRILWNFLRGKNPMFETARELAEKKMYFSKSTIERGKCQMNI